MFIFKLRRGTAAEWTAANTVLALGEPGLETDTKRLKAGDGFTPWRQLGYYFSDESVIALIQRELAANPITIDPTDIDDIADQVMLELELPDLVLLYENKKA